MALSLRVRRLPVTTRSPAGPGPRRPPAGAGDSEPEAASDSDSESDVNLNLEFNLKFKLQPPSQYDSECQCGVRVLFPSLPVASSSYIIRREVPPALRVPPST